MAHVFNPANMEKLDNPKRRSLLPPEAVLEAVGVRAGDVVADIGCGIGYFAIPAARLAGPEGRVYGIDISTELLAEFKRRASTQGVENVQGLLVHDGELPLPDSTIHLAMLCTVLHEIEEPAVMLAEIARILKPDGRLAVLEWKREPSDWGPPEDHRLASETVEDLLRQAGFEPGKTEDFNGYHYLIVASVKR